MAESGRLGAANIATAAAATVYEVPADTFAVISVNIVNRLNSPQTIRLAMAATGVPTDAEWIEYDVQIEAKGVLERTGLILKATEKVVVEPSAGKVTVVVFGIETPTA
jgi:hypothetical protein